MQRAFHVRNLRRQRAAHRVRNKVRGTPQRPRLSVHRSSGQIYVQAIDDVGGVTLAASSSLDPALREACDGNKTATARAVGKDIARRLGERGCKAVVFDRGWYRYHGRVKALADGAREGGLDF